MIYLKRKRNAPKRFDEKLWPDEWVRVDEISPRLKRELRDDEGRYFDVRKRKPKDFVEV